MINLELLQLHQNIVERFEARRNSMVINNHHHSTRTLCRWTPPSSEASQSEQKKVNLPPCVRTSITETRSRAHAHDPHAHERSISNASVRALYPKHDVSIEARERPRLERRSDATTGISNYNSAAVLATRCYNLHTRTRELSTPIDHRPAFNSRYILSISLPNLSLA